MCDLCKLEKKTRWHEDNEIFAILDCKTCKVPMVVLKRHTTEPTEEEMKQMLDAAKKLGGTLDFKRRAIPDHYHFHIR